MDEVRPGTLIAGRYAVARLLGRGASKVVYLAEDRLAGVQVAVAMLLGEGAHDATQAARFSREARAAAALRSPYVVRVFDVGKLGDGTRYLVTEAVLGRGLDEALEYGPVKPEQAARWGLHILGALEEAHARGVLHRDVKPENVLLAPTPAGEVAKLADFGLAKVLDGSLEGSMMLQTGHNVVLGTPQYMPPEQWQGIALDAGADVYATGITLYEMLIGRVPFDSKMLHAVCTAHLTQSVPAFPEDVSPLARAIEPVVRRALQKRAEDRYRSARAMREALAEAAGLPLFEPAAALSEPVASARCVRAELLAEGWSGPVRLVATPNVVIGRDGGSSHVVVRCLPPGEANDKRTQTVSRQHARIEWRGGAASVVDLGSRGGTSVAGREVGLDPVALRNGDEIGIGKFVTLKFEHAPAASGELPRWARLTRTDAWGAGQVHVLVLTEAKISAGADAAVRVPQEMAAGDVLRLRVHEGVLAVLPLGAMEPVPLRDGQVLRLGGLSISVALED